jgi:hypothetical protein
MQYQNIKYIKTSCVMLLGYYVIIKIAYISKISIACPVHNRHVISWLMVYDDHVSLN